MTTEELRRFLSYIETQLNDEGIDNEERAELVSLKWILKRELNVKDLGNRPRIDDKLRKLHEHYFVDCDVKK